MYSNILQFFIRFNFKDCPQSKILSVLSNENKVFSLFFSLHESFMQQKGANTSRRTSSAAVHVPGW